MRAIVDHPDLQGPRRFVLATRDAQAFYKPFGFVQVNTISASAFMEIKRPADELYR
jgi:hypothetical protein